MISRLQKLWNDLLSLIPGKPAGPTSVPGWSGNYSSWQDVVALCSGYDSTLILDKVKAAILKVKRGEAAFERDSVTFEKLEYVPEFLQIMEQIAKEKAGSLCVLDFGGSLGSVYFQYRTLFPQDIKLRWCVVEQQHFVDFGKKELEDEVLKFYDTPEDCIRQNMPDIILLSSVLSYIEKPYALLDRLQSFGARYILVDRNIFINDDTDRLTLQVVPEEIYRASYPCWILNESHVVNALKKSYELIQTFDPYDHTIIRVDESTAYFKALLFKRK